MKVGDKPYCRKIDGSTVLQVGNKTTHSETVRVAKGLCRGMRYEIVEIDEEWVTLLCRFFPDTTYRVRLR